MRDFALLFSLLLIAPLTESSNHSSSVKNGWRTVAHAARPRLTVPSNGRLKLTLQEEYTVPDGEAQIVLPISVLPTRISVEGDAPPRVISVNSSTPNGSYGAGDVIDIAVIFTSKVVWRPHDAAPSDRSFHSPDFLHQTGPEHAFVASHLRFLFLI